MIVRCRRLFESSCWNRTLRTLKTPDLDHPSPPRIHLSPSIVDSTVSRCPSDTLALSFFIWCARQPNYFHAPSSLDLMLPVVHRVTDRLGSVAAVVDELVSVGCTREPQILMLLLRVYWRGDMFRLALEVFDEMCCRDLAPNTFARNMVLDVLFKIGRFDHALRFFKDTRFPNFLTFNIVLRGLCGLGDSSGVRGVLREMIQRRFCANVGTFTVALGCFGKAGRVAELLQLLGFMIVSGERLSVNCWSIVMDSLCKFGRVDSARWLLGRMVDAGCLPSVVTYTTVIKGLFVAGMHDEAFEVVEEMSRWCAPDLVLFNVLIDSLAKAGRYGDAIGVFDHVLQEKKIKPDSYTLSSLISVLCVSGNTSMLPKLISGLDFFATDLVACNSLLSFLCKADCPFQAVEFYNDMIYKGFSPDSYSYAELLSSLCKLGWIDHAVNAYHTIVVSNPQIDPFVHTAILDGLVKRRMYHTAIKLFRESHFGNCRLDVVSYTIAIHGLFKGGRFHDACSLFNQMKQFGVAPNIYTYNVMLYGLCKAKEIDGVKQLLKEMMIAGIELDRISFNTLTDLMLKLHRGRPALLLFMKMCDLGMKPNWVTYCRLFNYWIHNNCDGDVSDLSPQLTYYLENTTFVDIAGSSDPDELPFAQGNR